MLHIYIYIYIYIYDISSLRVNTSAHSSGRKQVKGQKVVGMNITRHIRPSSVSELCVLLGAFAKLRKATISFVVSVRPSVRMKQLGYQSTEFHEI